MSIKEHNGEQSRIAELEALNRKYTSYLRQKTNQLLTVMGTEPLQREELDDQALLEFDPIGIIIESLAQVFDFLKDNINELQQARDELQAIFDATGVGISIIDRDFVVQRCNEKQRELLVDPSLDEVSGHRCHEIYCSKNSPGMDCPAVDTFATGRAVMVREVRKKNKFFQVVTTPYARDEQGEVSKVIEVSLDISEKKRAELAEEQQREHYLTEKSKLATVIESLAEGLLVLDSTDTITACNRAAAELTDHNEAQLVGVALKKLFPEARILLGPQGVENQGMEFGRPTGEGEQQILSANSSRLLDSANRFIGRVVTFRDITAEKKRRELFYRTEKLAAVGQLSAGVAHELNTPLCAILGYALLILKEDELSSTHRERVTIIVDQARKSSKIIKDLLSFTRHSRQGSLTQSNCDLKQVVQKALPVLATEFNKRRIELTSELHPVPQVVADPVQLEQVLLNLILNSVQAIDREGGIHLTLSSHGERVSLSIADTGPGVPEEIRSRIFDPFYTTKPIGEGTGLGLSICSGIIGELGGTIEVENSPEGGAVFTITLPMPPVPEVTLDKNAADKQHLKGDNY